VSDDPEVLTIDLPHLRVSALAWGPADGRLVLCLHGYPDTAWTWRYVGPMLAAAGYRVVAPFSRGYAPTAIPDDGDYHIGALMYDAIALHRELGGGSDAVLVGHDWGGMTASALAAHADSPFAKVVVMGVPFIPGFGKRVAGRVLRRMPRQARLSWYIVYQQLPGISDRTLGRVIPRLWRTWCPPGYDATGDLTRLWGALPDLAHRTAAVSYYRHQVPLSKPAPVYRALHEGWDTGLPRIPILLMHGQLDGAIDVGLAAISAEALPAGSRHKIIAAAGHFMQLDQAATVARLISDYVVASGS
jgi:pimeloyl-ACP methyl ester carboxylesterase